MTDTYDTIIGNGRSLRDILRIIDAMFTGTVTNAGTGVVTYTSGDGSTVTITGDGAGNRSSVVVNLV